MTYLSKKIISIHVCLLIFLSFLSGCQSENSLYYPETESPSPSSLTVDIPSYVESEDKPLYSYSRIMGDRYQYYNDCLYFYEGNGLGSFYLSATKPVAMLLRLNVKTGVLTFVCPDPLCMHNTPECPFAGQIYSLSIDENKMIYARQYSDADNEKERGTTVLQICSFDLNKMKLSIHHEKKIAIGEPYSFKKTMMYHDQKIYYYDMIYDEETKLYQQGLYRININNNRIDTIITPHTNNNINFLFILNDRIYFTDIATIYSVNPDMEDKQIHAEGTFSTARIYTDGQHIYYALAGKDSTDDLYRMNLDGSGVINLEINTDPSWFLTEKYIYYFPHDKMNILNPNGQVALISMCNTIWRCDHDGGNKTKVVELERSENGFIQIHDVQVIGNYAYTDYYEYVDKNESGFYESDQDRLYYSTNDPTTPHILRIDLTTGEVIKLNIPDV